MKGTFNLSLGKKIYSYEIINWLNSYNKKKENFRLNKRINKIDSFTLNNKKLSKAIKYTPKTIELKNFCLKLSKKIHTIL